MHVDGEGDDVRRRARLVVAATVGVILLGTLWPIPEAAYRSGMTPIWCILCGERALADILLNVAVFSPLGWGLRILGMRMGRVVLLAGAFSLGVETLQVGLIVGRDASLSDLLTNTTGALAGAALATYGRRLLHSDIRLSRYLSGCASGTLLVACGAMGWLASPSATETSQYWGQWAHTFGNTQPFRGRVLSALVNDIRVPDGRVAETQRIVAALERPTVVVEVRFSGGLPVEGDAQVFGVADGRGGIVAQLKQRNCSYGFSRRARAADWRLGFPAVWLNEACAGNPSDTVILRGTATRGELALRAESSTGVNTARLAITAGMGWTLLTPFNLPPHWHWLLPATWVGLLVLPVGYWTARAYPPVLAALQVASVAVLGFAVIPWVAGLAPSGWATWLGALGAIGFGGFASGMKRPEEAAPVTTR